MACQWTHVSCFNSPQFFLGLFGHSGLLIEHEDMSIHLYSFHPRPNNGEPFGHGSIAQLSNPADGANLDHFIRACMTAHADDHRWDNRGVRLCNGTLCWNERIRRIIRMEVTLDQAQSIEAFAQTIAADPPRFNVATYSCEHFVDDALAAGNVELRGKHLSLKHTLVPNYVYDRATADTAGIHSFQKIDFRSYLATSPALTQTVAPAAVLAAARPGYVTVHEERS